MRLKKILLIFLFSFLIFASLILVFAQYENFTTYTKHDPAGIEIAVNNATDIYFNDYETGAYLYKDFGANYFSNFTIRIMTRITNYGTYCPGQPNTFLALGNYIGTGDAEYLAKNTTIQEQLYEYSTSAIGIFFQEFYNGNSYQTTIYNVPSPYTQWFYVQWIKNGTSLNSCVFSDSGYSSVLANVTITLHASETYEYCYPARDWQIVDYSQPLSTEIANLNISNTITGKYLYKYGSMNCVYSQIGNRTFTIKKFTVLALSQTLSNSRTFNFSRNGIIGCSHSFLGSRAFTFYRYVTVSGFLSYVATLLGSTKKTIYKSVRISANYVLNGFRQFQAYFYGSLSFAQSLLGYFLSPFTGQVSVTATFNISGAFILLILFMVICLILAVVRIPILGMTFTVLTMAIAGYSATDPTIPFYPVPVLPLFVFLVALLSLWLNVQKFRRFTPKIKRPKRRKY